MKKSFKITGKGISAISLSIIIGLSVLLAPLITSADNGALGTALVNGDFENGTTGWSVTSGDASKFKTVNAKQADAHQINITGNAGYFVTTDTTSWLYQGVKLAAGEYTWQFHIDLYGTHNMVGAYTSLDGIGTAAGLIEADTFTAVNDQGVTSSAFKKETSDYRISLSPGSSHYTVTYVFTLTEEKDIYFAIRGNGGGCQYIDNMSLTKTVAENPTELVNGDFEDGTTGWSVTSGDASKFKTVNTKQADAHQINITGNAGYFETTDTASWLYQGVKLAAGEYTWQFHIDLYGTHNMVGAYTSLNGIGTAAGLIEADTFTAVNDQGVTSSAFKKDTSDYRISLSPGASHYTVTYVFTLAEEKDVYFAIRGNGGGCQYIDDMKLKDPNSAPEIGIVNGDFESGNLNGVKFIAGATSFTSAARVDSDVKHGGSYSFRSEATIDKETNANMYQTSRFDIPVAVEKNKYYRVSFWAKFNGTDTSDNVGFRISSAVIPSYTNSLMSLQYEIGETANIQVSDSDALYRHSGWAGYVNIFNTGKDNWVQYSVDFASADFETVYLGFTNFNRAGTVFWLDDIELNEISELTYPPKAKYDDPDILFYVTFDTDKENPTNVEYSNNEFHYTKTAEQAHSGKYSVKWDSSHNDGWQYLYFTDKEGNLAYNPKLEPKTAYRYSYWMKVTGNRHQGCVGVQKPGQSVMSHYNTTSDWEYVTIDFITEEGQTNYPIKMLCPYMRQEGTYAYIDDIKLEKLGPSVTAENIEGLYCEEFFNKIPNGNFEKPFENTIWQNDDITVERVTATNALPAEEGNCYAHLSGKAGMYARIKLVSCYQYNFVFSYRTKSSSNLKIGILDGNKQPLPAAKGSGISINSVLSAPISDGEWHRTGYTFLTPSDGYVYFYISGDNLDIDIDEVAAFKAPLSYTEDPNVYHLSADTDFNTDIDDSNSPGTGDNSLPYVFMTILSLAVFAVFSISCRLYRGYNKNHY